MGGTFGTILSPKIAPKAGNLQHSTPQKQQKQTRKTTLTRTIPTRPGASGPERILGAFVEVILVTFPGFAKNAAPHELTVNTDQIEGRAPVKASQKALKNQGKNGMKTKTKQSWIWVIFWVHFGRLLEGFWGPKAVRNSVYLFGPSFLRFRYAAWLRRDFDGTLTQVFPRRMPPRRRPVRARRDTITTARNAKHEIQHALGQRPGEFWLHFCIFFQRFQGRCGSHF